MSDDPNDYRPVDVWECEGSKAARAGKPASANPYPVGTAAYDAWGDGHLFAAHAQQREEGV